MEEPLVSFELREKYLLVIGHGRRDNFKDIVMASEIVYTKAVETRRRYILVDNRSVQINLAMSEAVNIVKRSEGVQREFKNFTAATVVNRSGKELGYFWKHNASKRGFNVEVFEDFDAVEKWSGTNPKI